jgi:hypothetical protein
LQFEKEKAERSLETEKESLSRERDEARAHGERLEVEHSSAAKGLEEQCEELRTKADQVRDKGGSV